MTAPPIIKRGELAGKIEHHQTMLRQLIIDLTEATLRIFTPMSTLRISSRSPSRCGPWRSKARSPASFLGTLREADKPLTTAELTSHIMASRGLNTADKKQAETVAKASARVQASPNCGIAPIGTWRRAT